MFDELKVDNFDVELDKEYIEKGVSGYHNKLEDRDVLQEIRADALKKEFDLNFDEKIGKGRTSSEKFEILDEMHSYIADELHASLHSTELEQIDLGNISAASIVQRTLKEAYDVCVRFYGEARK